jgi:hypothetical protein
MSARDRTAVVAPLDPHLRVAREAIDAATGRLSVETLRHPSEGRWSIAQILEHLTLAFTATVAALEQALASGELRPAEPVLKQKLARVLVVDLGYFPKVQAPKMTVPSGSIPVEGCVVAIQEALTALDAVLTRVEVRFGSAVAVANHPYFGGMSVRQWRKLHWRHTVHHMRQVRARS